MLKLSYKELFTDLDTEYQYPIEAFANQIPKVIGTSRAKIHLNFAGIDSLTDEVFFVLKSELKTAQKHNVESVDLTGCYFISDRGILVMSQAFPNLKQLILIGCHGLTHLSLIHLMDNCHKLDDLVAEFTGISYLPQKVIERWDENKIKVNPLFKHNNQEASHPVNLIIIALDPSLKYDISQFIMTGQLSPVSTQHQPITIKPYAWTLQNTAINIIELYCHHTYMAPFIQERSLFVIAMDGESHLSNSFNIIKVLDYIRAVTYSAPIELLMINPNSDTSNLDKLTNSLKSIFQDQLDNMKQHLDQEHYSKSNDKDFIDQWRYVQSLSAIDPEAISLHLLGYDRSQTNCKMCYCSTICEQSTHGKLEQIYSDFIPNCQIVKDSIDRITKADIAEARSLMNLPETLKKIVNCILKIFKKSEDIKTFLADNFLMGPFLDMENILKNPNPDETIEIIQQFFTNKEELDLSCRSSLKLTNAFGMWLHAKWTICQEISPIIQKARDLESSALARNQKTSSYDLIILNLQHDLLQLKKYMYHHCPHKFTNAQRIVSNAIEKINSIYQSPVVISLNKLANEITNQLTIYELIETLKQLQMTSNLMLYHNLTKKYFLFPNLSKLAEILNLLHSNWTGEVNGNRAWCISSKCPVATNEEMENMLKKFVQSDKEYMNVISILREMGLIMTIKRSWQSDIHNWEPVVEAPIKSTSILYFSFHNINQQADSNRIIVENPNNSSEIETQDNQIKISRQLFPNVNSSKFNKDDLYFKFSFKFRTGIPCNLFSQITAQIVANFRTVTIWSQGLIVYDGAVNILLLHNIHANRGSSSFDLESRIRKPIEGRRAVAVREHMWNFLSDIFTIIEGFILLYPYLHHKLRHYCRGQCFLELGQENTFSIAQISRSLTCNYFCSKCREYQMTQNQWLYVLGRQYLLPNHEIDQNNIKSCKFCWKNDYTINLLWSLQRKAFPVFSRLIFSEGSIEESLRGNLLKASKTQTAYVYADTKLAPNQLKSLCFSIINKHGCFIKFFDRSPSGIENQIFLWDLDKGIIETELVKYEEITQLNIVNGDYIEISVNKLYAEEDLELKIYVNSIPKLTCKLMSHISAYLCVVLEPNENLVDNESKVINRTNKYRIIVTNIDAARVTALHFRPGMIVLLKTETRWEPAIIYNILRGKLECVALSAIDAQHKFNTDINSSLIYQLPINSDRILPPGFYPSEINSSLDSKNQKALADSWYRIFTDHPEYTPAPFGLFTRIKDKMNYEPLPIFGKSDRECTTSIFASTRILHISYSEKNPNSRFDNSYIILPHPLTPEQLLMPHRHIINSYHNQALHKLCPGTKWNNYLADQHPLNEKPFELIEEQCKFLWEGPIKMDFFIVLKYFGTNLSALYQNLDESLPLINPDIDRDLLRDAIVMIIKCYRDIYLFDFVSRKQSYDGSLLVMNKLDIKKIVKMRKNPVATKNKSTIPNDTSKELKWFNETADEILGLFFTQECQCESHKQAKDVLRLSQLGKYCDCVVNIKLSNQEQLPNIQETALVTLSRLARLEISHVGMSDTRWLKFLPPIRYLSLYNCQLTEIDEGIERLCDSLRHFSIEMNPIEIFPDFLCEFPKLDNLNISNTLISELPENFGHLKKLRYLAMNCTMITTLPKSFGCLTNLSTLKFQGIKPPDFFIKNNNRLMGKTEWIQLCKKSTNISVIYNSPEIHQMLEDCFGEKATITTNDYGTFRKFLNSHFPKVTEFPEVILDCINLQSLIMPFQGFPSVPDKISQLSKLRIAIFSNNDHLETLSGYLGYCPLDVLSCENCDNLKTPPLEVRRKGMRNTIAYLIRLISGNEEFYRTKLMLVGLGGAGKTSLIRALMSKDYKAPHLAQEAITDGIDIAVWSSKQAGDNTPIQFSVWDFAGQTLYYNTHQFFLTHRAVYLLMWNVRQGYEHSGLDFWLNSISCHAPNSPIFIVGTHCDKVDKSEIPENLFKERYPSIAGFHFVSSLLGTGVKELHDSILSVTRAQSYMGEAVPNVWLRFEKALISKRSTHDYLMWDQVKSVAMENAIYESEINEAISFLHHLGSIQYFETPLLRDYVIINSQWLVDVMACVVSVKSSLIQDGKLYHNDVNTVWKDYPVTIHKWLLKLTEIFDLTFSVPGGDFNYVPCLLPNKAPQFDWPLFVESSDIKESNMHYQFEYLPPGLFNRAQVRLSQYSDSFIIWHNGSLLQKNEDKALMVKLNDNTLKICARGYWPDNIMFIIHEVLETLISESFSGVNYEYQLSCRKCVAEKDTEPHFFPKSILQRAAKSKTNFIQCHKNFHILLMQEIQESMPPDSLEDYDLQFKKSMQFISSQQDQLHNKVMFLCAKKDFEDSSNVHNITRRIAKDLNNNFSVYSEPVVEGAPQDIFIDMITRCEVIVTIISINFIKNKTCMTLFKIAKNTLSKNMCLAIIDKEFKEEAIGYEIAGEKYINFERANVYDMKLVQLIRDIETFSGENSLKKVSSEKPRVFISYCWDNSQRAFDRGNSKVLKKESIGWGDPRDIKDYLEENGIRCWLDVDQTISSLYSEIVEGMKDCEVFVACISKEYIDSDICRKEFMFAKQNLRLPIVIAEVGCNDKWKRSEIGMLSIEYQLFSFQKPNKSSFKHLLKTVKELLPIQPTNIKPQLSTDEKRRKQENFELIQRKIYRLLSSGFGSEESRIYPCVMFVDILNVDESQGQNTHTHYNLCFRVLCENEAGWHAVNDGLPVHLGFNELHQFLKLASPYLFRITQLLRLGDDVGSVKLFDDSTNPAVAEEILETMKKNAKNWNFVKPLHRILRNHMIEKDAEMICGGLKLCCLNNGKLTWLCPEHANSPFISTLNIENSGNIVDVERQHNYENIEANRDNEIEELDESRPSSQALHYRAKSSYDYELVRALEDSHLHIGSDSDSSSKYKRTESLESAYQPEQPKFNQSLRSLPESNLKSPGKTKLLIPNEVKIPSTDIYQMVSSERNFTTTCATM